MIKKLLEILKCRRDKREEALKLMQNINNKVDIIDRYIRKNNKTRRKSAV